VQNGRLRDSVVYTTIWWVLESVALLALLSGAVMFGPLDRKNAFLSPELAESVAVAAAVIALVALVILAVTALPGNALRTGAQTLAILTGIVVVVLLGYRLAVGTGDARDFDADQFTTALPLLWLSLIPLAAQMLRLERVRRAQRSHR